MYGILLWILSTEKQDKVLDPDIEQYFERHVVMLVHL